MNWSYSEISDLLTEAVYRAEVLSITAPNIDDAKTAHWRFAQVRTRMAKTETDPTMRASLEMLKISREGEIVLVGRSDLFPEDNMRVKWCDPDDVALLTGKK